MGWIIPEKVSQKVAYIENEGMLNFWGIDFLTHLRSKTTILLVAAHPPKKSLG